MIIGGLEKFSLIDYPGHLAAIVFTSGCNFRCHFCYNPMLVEPGRISSSDDKEKGRSLGTGFNQIQESDLFEFLQTRVGKIDAVVVTGGEPTLHHDLPEFIKKLKDLGFKVKLDTNGTNPQALKNLLEQSLIDYIAMDIKGPFEKYDLVVGAQINKDDLAETISLIKASGLSYEFRSTIVPGLHEFDDVAKMGEMIKGAQKWFLQPFKSDVELVNNAFKNATTYSDADMEKMCEVGKMYVDFCEVR
ncbi:anaerobic ribonucleoside-triphosphate reductase activating protein [Candidatus Parcubacteria bacterium]|nr:anaerobic ribonucleoside-triphosphate reductase activating protein [Patescibacteria group bacterium]MBU4309407.1 anaerobic ribonucleoside-triphosphate reductase activating protein [Patescibacteria group bacterium]MBU4431970.1 anaerobic ribonucleoside-triphosphate reductase activating protein [Patescibacteria group bacterium]MBU4577768.1 anaerobic ribonucleoside-triphosphate reductase activating protein [Patescibacteria group bacterium]MCG2697453.1 anaerobic ribonucleoside-triphosphate reduct